MTTTMNAIGTVPRYDDLPLGRGGRSAWGVFGPDDTIGRINLLTERHARDAARLVRTGKTFPLNLPLDHFPRMAHRIAPRHELQRRGPEIYKNAMIAYDELLHDFNPQGSSQWDALAHASADEELFYNGTTDADIVAGTRCTIDHWARRGIVGRGVLVDVARYFRDNGIDYDPATAPEISIAHLEGALSMTNTELRSGDILLINLGFLEWVDSLDAAAREAVMTNSPLNFVGLEHHERMARWLWDSGVAAVATDAPGVEKFPADFTKPFGSMHRVLIGLLGFPLGELFDLTALAEDCEEDGTYEFMFTSAPLNIRAGVGSPPNALALK
ncbi:cyclase family protein [Mycolicibacterium goodii]